MNTDQHSFPESFQDSLVNQYSLDHVRALLGFKACFSMRFGKLWVPGIPCSDSRLYSDAVSKNILRPLHVPMQLNVPLVARQQIGDSGCQGKRPILGCQPTSSKMQGDGNIVIYTPQKQPLGLTEYEVCSIHMSFVPM